MFTVILSNPVLFLPPCTARTQSLHSTAAACLASSTAAMWTSHSATTCSTSYSTAKVRILSFASLSQGSLYPERVIESDLFARKKNPTYSTLADKPAAARLWLATDVNISSVGSVQLRARSIHRMKMTPWGSRCTQVCSIFGVLLRDALLLFSLCPFGCDTWAQRCGFCGRLCEGENHQWLVFPLIRSWESCSIVKW